jgi:phytoene desaturase
MATAARGALKPAYDVVVIGSGMGGLSAGAALAKAGRSVLVAERHSRPGGFAHGFERDEYRFDVAVHMTSGAEPRAFGEGAFLDQLLRILGVRDLCTFLPIEPFYRAIFPDLTFDAPTGSSEFVEAHARLFPGEEAGLRDFLRLCVRLNREIKRLPVDVSSYDELSEPERFTLHFEYAEATLADVIADFIKEPRLQSLLAALWPYQGLPPSRLAFVRWTPMLMSYLEAGVFYCAGGFQNLANALVTGLERHGGELVLDTAVERIHVEDGKVAGVELAGGHSVAAAAVVSNADATSTFEELIGPEHLPQDYVAHLRSLTPSLSAVTAYLATDLDLAEGEIVHEAFAYDSWDYGEVYQRILAGVPAEIAVTVPTTIDRSLAPPGEHVVTLMTLIPYGLDIPSEVLQERLLARAGDVIPGLPDHITFGTGASPHTMERYTLNHHGAIYGWEPTPQQTGAARLGRRTPVQGLWLAGHWTQPGGGVMPVVVSGLQTAQALLEYPNIPALMADLEEAA